MFQFTQCVYENFVPMWNRKAKIKNTPMKQREQKRGKKTEKIMESAQIYVQYQSA